jgi:aromatic-L-amino-acid decarboxylase
MKKNERNAPLNISGDAFRALGHELVERIADFYDSLPERPLTRGKTPREIRALIGDGPLPDGPTDPGALLGELAPILFDNSLHNGHPRFFGYITSSAAPLGALADLLAAAVNSNVGLWELSPVVSEIERQTVRWLAEFIGYPSDCGGLMVSGGNMANLVPFFAARRAKAPWNIRDAGIYGDSRPMTVYASDATHTWIEKAADLSGIGVENIRRVASDAQQRMVIDELEAMIDADREAGRLPFMVVGAAGTVGTGEVDPLSTIAAICRKHALWFHVDGAYGAPAAAVPGAHADLRGLALADSVALDPHKWLYCPIEVGCALVRRASHLTDAFSFHPSYYRLSEEDADPTIHYYEYGMQNTRGSRALKVWLGLRSTGRSGYVQMIEDDIALARQLYDAADHHPELEAVTCALSITTFRYRPAQLALAASDADAYLNALNEALLARLQGGGEAFVSNAVLQGRYLLRACVVNFRTTPADIDRLVDIVVRLGREIDAQMRPER